MCATQVYDPAGSPSEVAIRPMQYDDLDRVCAIENVSFTCPWTRESFRRLVPRKDADMLVAEVGASVAGYAVIWYAGDDAELGNLAVAPECRQRGIGRQLLDAAIEQARARGMRRLFLEVRVSNAVAEALYRSRGFVPVGIRPRYYQRPVEDARVMRLSL